MLHFCRFYPEVKTIMNHVDLARMRKRLYRDSDQKECQHKVQEWKERNPEDSFHIRLKSPPSNQENEVSIFKFHRFYCSIRTRTRQGQCILVVPGNKGTA